MAMTYNLGCEVANNLILRLLLKYHLIRTSFPDHPIYDHPVIWELWKPFKAFCDLHFRAMITLAV